MTEPQCNLRTHSNNKKCIHVIALGGTIACLSPHQTDEFYRNPSANINELITLLPINPENLTIVTEQLLQQISHEMTHDDLLTVAKRINELVNQDAIDGVVITQGTNCIEESAYFINLVVKTKKPIVFTGSFRPRNALGYDGIRNLYNSILIASNEEALGLGVVLCFNDSIVNARDASKLSSSILGDFSINGMGLLGFVQGKNLHIQKLTNYRHTYLSEFAITEIKNFLKIYIIYGHLGLDSSFVNAVIANGVKGIISAGMGKGYQSKEVTEALGNASKKGIFVVRCSKAWQGIVSREDKIDDKYDFIAGGSLSPQKARILLSVAINKTKDKTEIQRIFNQY